MKRKTNKQPHIARWMVLPLVALAWASSGLAAEYPDRPIRLVVSFPPGGSADFQARIIGTRLSERLGQQIIIDNRPGGSGVVALELVAKSAPNGYTLLLGGMSHLTMAPFNLPNVPFDSLRDFSPISMTSRVTLALTAGPSLPASSVKELIALAKASPGKLSYGSTGIGGVTHLAGEMMKSVAGIELIHVPYKGAGPQLIDVMSGNVAVGFTSLTATIPHMRAGRLKVLMVTSKQRSSAAPDAPTVSEVGMPEIEICSSWFGILAPAQTPRTIISRLNSEIVRVVQMPDTQSRFAAQGLDLAKSTVAEFSVLIKSDLVRWEKIIKEAGIRAE